jgi:hypothetical protein
MARLNGTLTVTLPRRIASQDGKRVYLEGETVSIAIAADASVRVWSGDRPPVLATFHQLVGADVPEAANA